MSEIAVWFERKFSFDFPVEMYPNFRIRLRGAPARLEDLTRGLDAVQLTERVEDKWSIQENAGHLLDLEELWMKRVDDFLAGAEVLAAADLTNKRTNEARHNEKPLEAILREFRATRLRWVERLDRLRPHEFSRRAKHPRLEMTMRLVDHLYFVAEHDDHHLGRIWELKLQGQRYSERASA
jgi:uncharacterized damage-inducible protein DinB